MIMGQQGNGNGWETQNYSKENLSESYYVHNTCHGKAWDQTRACLLTTGY